MPYGLANWRCQLQTLVEPLPDMADQAHGGFFLERGARSRRGQFARLNE